MMDLVVDLVSNMLDNWGCGNMVSSWGSISISSSWDNSRGSNMVGSWSSISISSSWDNSSLNCSDSWGSDSNWGSMSNWVNETILVYVLRESFQGERSISAVGGN